MNSPDNIKLRAEKILCKRLTSLHAKTDRLFALLFVLQWVSAIVAALVLSPRTWTGNESSWHVHLWASIILGGFISLAPVVLAIKAPGHYVTRFTVSIAQAGYSVLLIHLTGGRIETHFHIFGSLAFLAFYRDWRVLLPATIVVTVDHLARGMLLPESVFGVTAPSFWRAIEHSAWIAFEDIFLVWSCVTGMREMRQAASTQADLENAKETTEHVIEEQTAVLRNRTQELESSLVETERVSDRLVQSQKLEAIGHLAAGVAHEINTPMQYLSDNSIYIHECMDRLLRIADSYAETLDTNGPKIPWKQRHENAVNVLKQYRYEELQKEVPAAIAENLEGISRVVTIVRAMKEFSHPGSTDKVPTDLNQAIRSTVTITRNRWRFVAEVELDLDSELPEISILPAEINQVILNLIVNATDAIRDKLGDEPDEVGRIGIRTYSDGAFAVIEVNDSGNGIPEEVKNRVFDPFFTTKEVGQGTGQGLAISLDIVTNKHGGHIDVATQMDEGTTFSIWLPLDTANTTGNAFDNNEPMRTTVLA